MFALLFVALPRSTVSASLLEHFTDSLPQTVSTTPSELYPFVFFRLQNLSNKRWRLAKY